jgi:hypothetical protein
VTSLSGVELVSSHGLVVMSLSGVWLAGWLENPYTSLSDGCCLLLVLMRLMNLSDGGIV